MFGLGAGFEGADGGVVPLGDGEEVVGGREGAGGDDEVLFAADAEPDAGGDGAGLGELGAVDGDGLTFGFDRDGVGG